MRRVAATWSVTVPLPGGGREEGRTRPGLAEATFRHLMRVAIAVREGAISSSTLLKRLRSGPRKNATCTAFRGRPRHLHRTAAAQPLGRAAAWTATGRCGRASCRAPGIGSSTSAPTQGRRSSKMEPWHPKRLSTF
ncbi:Tn3 family transposase [Streptomyces sp. NPDC101225]|uniref:Tn3 family transposase n=1 Tax=Streptomyces sp. NPDC101225 TaxID=3366135 RepID=UPI0037F9BD45